MDRDYELPMSRGFIVASEPFINKALSIEATEHEAMRVAANINSKLEKSTNERFKIFEVLIHIKRNNA